MGEDPLVHNQTDSQGRAFMAYAVHGFFNFYNRAVLRIEDRREVEGPRCGDWMRSWTKEEVWGKIHVLEARVWRADEGKLRIELVGLEEGEELPRMYFAYQPPEDQIYYGDRTRSYGADGELRARSIRPSARRNSRSC